MSKQLSAQMKKAAEECLAAEIQKASNETIKKKLENLALVCRTIVAAPSQALSIAEVVREYKARFPKQPLSEQTIRNKRPNGNPYMTVYRAWESVAHAAATAALPTQRKDGLILRESDLHTIKDPTLRHQVTAVFAQNRSLHNRLNMLKKIQGQRQIRVLLDGPGTVMAPAEEDLVLTPAELDAIRDFIDPRKLRAKHLEPSKDDGVFTIDGGAVADPGFLSALRKISKSYERPE
ncbi:gamma-mobile-trio protein GmtX [Bradyrhizobium sp. USDA 10063]